MTKEVEHAGWKPIETAPKDGTCIFGIRREGKASWVIYWKKDGWHIPGTISSVVPTHWMPIPEIT